MSENRAFSMNNSIEGKVTLVILKLRQPPLRLFPEAKKK